jgi:hypothetical protein
MNDMQPDLLRFGHDINIWLAQLAQAQPEHVSITSALDAGIPIPAENPRILAIKHCLCGVRSAPLARQGFRPRKIPWPPRRSAGSSLHQLAL